MRTSLAIVALLVSTAGTAWTQSAIEPRAIVLADIGYARTLDDEGLLGSGAAVSAGAGYRLTPRLTIQAMVERIPYDRDNAYLTFDGRVLFAGIEAAFQSTRRSVRPFVTIGAGLMNDEKVWTHKTAIGPGESRIDDRTEHRYTRSMMTASTGLDFRVSDRASVRAGMRFHGLLDTGDDLAAHIILQPAIGAAFRW